MIKIACSLMRGSSLTHSNKFSFIEPSCYNIKGKINPVINVTLSNQRQEDVCVLQFRVPI